MTVKQKIMEGTVKFEVKVKYTQMTQQNINNLEHGAPQKQYSDRN